MTSKRIQTSQHLSKPLLRWLALLPVLLAMTRLHAATDNAPVTIEVQPCVFADRAVSTEHSIEFEHQFTARESREQRFFFVAPFGRKLTGAVLAARLGVQRDGGRSEYLAIAELPETMVQHASRIHSSFNRTYELGTLRNYRVIEMRVMPLLANQPREKIWLDSVHVRLTFDRPVEAAELRRAAALADPRFQSCRDFAFVMSRFVSNADAMRLYGNPDPPLNAPGRIASEPVPIAPRDARPLLKMWIDQDGVYKVDQELLQRHGLDPAEIRPDRLHVYLNGEPVPSELIGGLGAAFQPRDLLLFYGRRSESHYSRFNVYWLVSGGEQPPLRMQSAQAAESGVGLTRPQWYLETRTLDDATTLIKQTDNFLSIKDYCWVYSPLELDRSLRLEFDLPGLADPAQLGEETVSAVNCTANLFLLSFSNRFPQVDPAAVITITLNGREHKVLFRENRNRTMNWSVPVKLLKPDGNVLEIVRVDHTAKRVISEDRLDGIVYLDSFAVDYPCRLRWRGGELTLSNRERQTQGGREYRIAGELSALPIVLEITDPARPKRLSVDWEPQQLRFQSREQGLARYLITSVEQLREPARATAAEIDISALQAEGHVDYLIISHHDFLAPARRLADFHEQRGMRCRVIDVEAVYDGFEYGQLSPVAIKAFLAFAQHRWPAGGPLYVVLFGDATSDYRGDFRNEVENFVPTYTLDRGENLDRWASDHWYTTIAGYDLYSDLILGRISVAHPTDAFTVVNKTIQYLSDPAPGPWRQTVTLVADDGRFREDCEDLRVHFIPPAYRANRIYLDDQPLKDNFYLPQSLVEQERMKVSPVMTTKIMDAFNAGCLITTFHGHGSPNIWTDERVWFGGDSENSDNMLLRNRAQLPLLINMTCNSGAIDYPQPPWNICITEDFMRVRKGGVIACYVPTGPGIPFNHQKISRILMNNLFHQRIDQVGPALLLSQYQYLAHRFSLDIVQMFLYLGDPALVLPRTDRIDVAQLTDAGVLQGTTATLRFEHQFPNLNDGYARVNVFDPGDRLYWSSPRSKLNRGRISRTVTIPADAELGAWHVRAYAWDANSNDAAAWAVARVDRPWLQLIGFEAQEPRKIYLPGESAGAGVRIKNPSWIAVDDGVLEIFGEDQAAPLHVETVACPAQGEISLKLSLKIPADFKHESGLCGFRAELRNYRVPSRSGIEPVIRQYLLLPAGAPAAAQEVRFRADLRPPSIIRRPEHYEVEWPVYFISSGSENPPSLHFTVLGGQASQFSQWVDSLDRLNGRWIDFTGELQDLSPAGELEMTCNRAPQLFGTNRRELKIPPELLPELRIDREGLRVTPASPLEGETIFIRAPVLNRGGSTARGVKIELYDQDPLTSQTAPLQPQFESRLRDGLTLYPGIEQQVELRWDPTDNAGTQTLWVKLDSAEEFSEADESDNVVKIELYARGKHRLKAGGLFIEKTEDRFLIKLNVRLINQGESDAHNVLIEFFRTGVQSAENKMGELLIPRIPARSQITAPRFHRISEQDLQSMKEHNGQLIVTYRAGLKGSLQRISSIDVARNER